MKSKRPTISPNFNFLGQLLEYEKELRTESILEPKSEPQSELQVCSQKRLCKRDMRKLSLSLDIEKKANKNNTVVLPKKEDHSPTSALAKLSFDVPSTEESEPSFSNKRPMRSKSCYGDWLRSADTTNEKKANEVPTTSKILSPVKEIKCEGLISEISTGYHDISMKPKDMIRQRISYFSSKSHEYQTSSENVPRSKKNKIFESRKYRWQMEEKKDIKSNVKLPYIPHVRSSENLYQSENSMKSEGYQDHYSYHNKNRPVHYSLSLNSDLHKLSDPSGSPTYINRNLNHRTYNFNQMESDMRLEGIFINKNLESNLATSENELLSGTFFGDKNLTLSSSNSDYHLSDDAMDRNKKVRHKTGKVMVLNVLKF